MHGETLDLIGGIKTTKNTQDNAKWGFNQKQVNGWYLLIHLMKPDVPTIICCNGVKKIPVSISFRFYLSNLPERV